MASSIHLVVANLVLLFVIAYSQVLWCNNDSSIEPDSLVSTNIDNLLGAITDAAKTNNQFSALASGAGTDVVYAWVGPMPGRWGCKLLVLSMHFQDAAQLIKALCPDVTCPKLKSGIITAPSGIARTNSSARLMPHKIRRLRMTMITRIPTPCSASWGHCLKTSLGQLPGEESPQGR